MTKKVFRQMRKKFHDVFVHTVQYSHMINLFMKRFNTVIHFCEDKQTIITISKNTHFNCTL